MDDGYYARSGKFKCQKCEDQSVILAKLFGLVFVMILYVAAMVTIIIKSANRHQENSVLVRIITNYFQIILLVRNLEVFWPERVEKLLDSLSFVSSATEDMF
jgi:hypothetical protein